MHRLFEKFIQPELNARQPSTMLEIGVLHGKSTLDLLKWCSCNSAHLTSLDPVEWVGDLPESIRRGSKDYAYKRGQEKFENWTIRPEGLEEAFRLGLDKHWNCVKQRSLDYFVSPNLEVFDAYLIDGDHNYFTVMTELMMIHRDATKGTMIFLHDVSETTNARRDEYYDPSLIPDSSKNTRRQGVLTAVEDFLANVGGGAVGRRFFAPYNFRIVTTEHDGLGLLVRL